MTGPGRSVPTGLLGWAPRAAARSRRSAATLLAALLVGVALALLVAPPASAHAYLQETTPADGQVVATSPANIELRFSEPVEASLGGITVLTGEGTDVTVGKVHHVAGAGSRIAVDLRPNLPDGSFLVNWRAQSVDSHPIDGAFTFSVGAPGVVAAAAVPVDQSILVALLALARFAGYAGLMLAVGTFAFLGLCWPSGWGDPTARTLLWSGLGAAGTATVLGFLLQGTYVAGGGLGSVLNPSVLANTADTRFGHAFGLRLVLLLALALTLRLVVTDRTRPPARRVQVGVAAGLVAALATVPLAGHAGASTRRWLDLPLDLAHLVAVSVWMGGLVALVAALVTRRTRKATDDGLSTALPRFSRVAMVCVGVLVLTGVIVGWRQIGSFGALPGTPYGRLLAGKIALLGLILAFAAASRAGVARRLAASGTRVPPVSELSSLRRSVGAEVSLGIVVVVLTSTLVSLPPGRTEYRPTTSETLAAGPVAVDLMADPRGPRVLDLFLIARDKAGDPRKLAELRTTLTLPARDISVPVALRKTTTGSYHVFDLTLPVAGKWRLEVYLRTSAIDSYTARTTLTVR